MRTRIVTWMGNGEERVDFDGYASRVSVADGSVADVHIDMIFLQREHVHIVVGPVGVEFNIIGVTPHGIGQMLMLTTGRPSSQLGKRPVNSATVSVGGNPVRYV